MADAYWNRASFNNRARSFDFMEVQPPSKRTPVTRMAKARTRRLLIRHTAFRGVLHHLDVLEQGAALGLVGWHAPGLASSDHLAVIHIHRQHPALGVDGDYIAVPHQGDGPAFLGLGHDMADDEAVGPAREAAIGEQRDTVPQPGPHD